MKGPESSGLFWPLFAGHLSRVIGRSERRLLKTWFQRKGTVSVLDDGDDMAGMDHGWRQETAFGNDIVVRGRQRLHEWDSLDKAPEHTARGLTRASLL